METLAVTITTEMKERLEALSAAIGRPVSDCLALAVHEFVETWEVHLNDVHQITEQEVRAVLKAANE